MRTVAETEDIGIETIAELQSNREKIESARAKVCYYIYSQLFIILTVVLTCCMYSYFRARSSRPLRRMPISVSSPCGSDTRHGAFSAKI